MPRLRFTSNLQRHVACPDQEVAADTVAAALDAAFTANPRLRSYIVDDQGRLRRHVSIYVNGVKLSPRAGLDGGLAAGDEVFVVQALSGG